MKTQRDIWFPAKRYGWGWGFPACWQGWAVYGGYAVLLVIGAICLFPAKDARYFYLYALVLSLVLVLVCWMKGEVPKWRWGDKSEP
jgi:hypothetical protein